jgi:acyl-CoA reductase-like NAD-dependent aldehyde dehydrogenase
MATRLTYTTGSRSAELDRAFEQALAEARGGAAEPLPHIVRGRDVATGKVFEREDPSRRDRVATRAHEGGEVVEAAVGAAREAQREWRRLPHSERVAVLRATTRLIDEYKLFLAATISLEVGKVRTESIA